MAVTWFLPRGLQLWLSPPINTCYTRQLNGHIHRETVAVGAATFGAAAPTPHPVIKGEGRDYRQIFCRQMRYRYTHL